MSENPVPSWTCAGCGRPESETGPLTTTPRAFRSPAALCAPCRHRTHRRSGVALWLLLLTPAATAWLSPFLTPEASLSPWVQRLGGLYLFEALFVLLHELGHAAAGHAVGYRIEQVRLGYGALVAAGRFLGTEWNFRLLPYGGLCFGFHPDPAPSRRTRALFLLGGPTVNLLLMLLGIAATWLPKAPETVAPPFWERLELPWILIWGNAWLLVWSLVPMRILLDGHRLPNDALQLWHLRTGREEEKPPAARDLRHHRRILLGRWVGFGIQALGAMVGLFGLVMVGGAIRDRHPVPLLVGVAVLFLCGGMLVTVGRALNRPRLRAARDLSSNAVPAPLLKDHVADQERFLDGVPLASLQALWLRSQTLLEQGRAAEALGPVRELLQGHRRCLALREIEFNILAQLGRMEDARTCLADAHGIDGIGEATRVVLRHHEFLLLAKAGATTEAVRLADESLSQVVDPPARLALLDLLASMPLLAAHGEFLEQADRWSAEAMSLDPNPTIRATRAGVLCEMDRVEEAEPLLRSVVAEATEPADLGLGHLYLALLENRRGNRKAARREAWAAFSHYPDRRLVERLASDGLASG